MQKQFHKSCLEELLFVAETFPAWQARLGSDFPVSACKEEQQVLSAASEEGSQIGKREPWGPFIYFFLFKHASLKTWYRLSSFHPDPSKKG